MPERLRGSINEGEDKDKEEKEIKTGLKKYL